MLPKCPVRLLATPVIALCFALTVAPARAELVSEDSEFGEDTITLDTETGLRWLDLPLSTNLTYVEVLAELEPGGDFEGYRIATRAEVQELFSNAGIDIATSDWVETNYDPIVALTALVGQTGSDPCGTGCSRSFSQGWTETPQDPPPSSNRIATVLWIDNSELVDPTLPQSELGRVLVGGTADPNSANRAAWLVQVPEPATAGTAAVLALAVLARRRSRR